MDHCGCQECDIKNGNINRESIGIQHNAKVLIASEINSSDGINQENAPGIGFLEQYQTQMFLGGHATEHSVRGEFNASEF